jgi:hypothetical protein
MAFRSNRCQAILDEHPIEKDRDRYLKRALAMQLLQLDASGGNSGCRDS